MGKVELKYIMSNRVVSLDRDHAERTLKRAAKNGAKIELIDENLYFDGGFINEKPNRGASKKSSKRGGTTKSKELPIKD